MLFKSGSTKDLQEQKKVNLTAFLRLGMIDLYKLDGVAPLMTDPPTGNSITWQNPPICNQPLYVYVTVELIIQLVRFFLGSSMFPKTNSVKNYQYDYDDQDDHEVQYYQDRERERV